MILGVLIATFCLPIDVAHARVQNISITKLIDQPNHKETLFVITTNENTYHILVTANLTVLGDETLIDLTATLINPHNGTIIASARIPDTLTDAPYLDESVEAFPIHFPDWVVDALKLALPIVMVVALVIQVYMILETIIEDVLEAILDIVLFGNFIYASLPWVLLTLLTDENPDGSVDLYVPYEPYWDHFMLLLEGHYFVATSLSWWEIVKHEVYTKVCIPFLGCYRIVWFTYYTAEWVYARAEPPAPKPPHASFEWEPIQPMVGEETVFNSTSFDPDGFITSYHWWLGDGNESVEEGFTHFYLETGNYNVTLQVTDNDGLTDNVTRTISVQSRPEARLRVIPTHLTVDVTRGHSATAEFITRESLNQTDLQGVTFQASDLKNPDGDVVSSGNVTFNKNGIAIAKGSYTNVTVTFQAPTSLPTGWYNGNVTAFSENGGNDTIYVDLMISTPLCELTVTSSPVTGVTYTINGSERTTPHTQLLPEGFYTLEMPQTHSGYFWSHWLEDGDTNKIKTITLQGTTWTAVYESSPPPVGGKATPINLPISKLELLNPYIGLTMLLAVAVIAVGYVKKRKRHTEIISKTNNQKTC